MISRRNFFKKTIQASIGSTLLAGFSACNTENRYTQSISSANASLGHRLRTMDFGPVKEIRETDIVIVGGGVSGLSAARFLHTKTERFILLEMGDETGGNSLGGSNSVSSFPLGAHYLPIPNTNDPELLLFLEEAKVITGYKNELPILNEYFLCFDPKERLFINNYWQEGLIPHEGVPVSDREEIQRFLSEMEYYKKLKGKDEKDAFCIPVSFGSTDPAILALDSISIAQYLKSKNYSSPYLQWYVAYCCADDYGTTLDETSAWAAIHYYASRKGMAANATADQVLTWPEGNYWLIKELRKNIDSFIRKNSLVYNVKQTSQGISVFYFDAIQNHSIEVRAKKVILSTPQYINKQLLSEIASPTDFSSFTYAPWMVANITVNGMLDEKRGEALCWDNVVYGSGSLGYVNATHQNLQVHNTQKVLTFYHPIVGENAPELRKMAQLRNVEDWKSIVLKNLKMPHPDIEKEIQELSIWIWGHGMVKPTPGFVWGSNLAAAKKPIGTTIFFAHSDISGISIFEEAFFNGHRAADQCIQSL